MYLDGLLSLIWVPLQSLGNLDDLELLNSTEILMLDDMMRSAGIGYEGRCTSGFDGLRERRKDAVLPRIYPFHIFLGFLKF